MLRKTTATCSAGKYRTRTAAPGINAAISVISSLYSCGVRGSGATSPAHEFFGSRKLRLAPQDYSPWTPPSDRFLVRSYPASAGGGRGQGSCRRATAVHRGADQGQAVARRGMRVYGDAGQVTGAG